MRLVGLGSIAWTVFFICIGIAMLAASRRPGGGHFTGGVLRSELKYKFYRSTSEVRDPEISNTSQTGFSLNGVAICFIDPTTTVRASTTGGGATTHTAAAASRYAPQSAAPHREVVLI